MKGLRLPALSRKEAERPLHPGRRTSLRARAFARPAAGSTVEALEGRQLLSAALTGTFSALPASLPTGSADAVTLRVANTGNARARGPVAVQLYASADGAIDVGATLLTGQARRLSLKPGAAAAVPLRFTPPASLPAGSYYLVARIDGSGAGGGIATGTVVSPSAVSVEQSFVDLTGKITSLPARPVEFGRHPKLTSVTVSVANQGNVIARGRVSVTVYLSVDGRLDSTAVPVNVSLPRSVRIMPGGRVSLRVPFRAPDGTAPGQYFVLAQVNARGVVDRDEGNNLAASASQVQVIPAPTRGRRGFGWYAGASFYPYDVASPDYGFYGGSEGYAPPPTDPASDTPGSDTSPPYDPPTYDPPPSDPPPTEPPAGGSTDTSSSSSGADFGSGSDPGAGDSGSGSSGSSGSGSSGGDSGGSDSSDSTL